MLRIHHSVSVEAAKNYFNGSLTRGDYYFEGQEIAGQWKGRGAQQLGLSGEVKKDDFFKLLENTKPDGSRLTLSTKSNRRPGYDMTFDVPKSVSVLHAHSGDDRIRQAMHTAVMDTMQEMEREMHTRVRKNGADHDRPTGNMIWADFTHFTTRPAEGSKHLDDGLPDPQLHMHVYVMNATFDAQEKQWKAGQFGEIKKNAPYFQAAYHTRLAGELQKLGYDITPTKDAFEVVGVSDKTKGKFSRRTREIDSEAAKRGITDVKQKADLGAQIRRSKDHDLTMPELREAWRKGLSWSERADLKETVKLAACKPNPRVIQDKRAIESALDYAIDHDFARQSELSEKRLLATTLQRSIGRATVGDATYQVRRDDRLLIGTIEGERRATTKEILREETELLDMIRQSRGSRPPLITEDYDFQEGLFTDPTKDTTEQKAAVLHVLKNQDWVSGLVGRAGTGKTTLMQEVRSGVEKTGRKMVVCAPTAEASRGVLRKEGFEDANTIQYLLQNDKVQDQLRGNVLWVDEAGMLGNQATLKLLQLAKEKGACRVVLAGDPTQIRSVSRGDAFKFLEDNGGLSVARLSTIQRQKDKHLKSAVQSISEGQIGDGFSKLDKHMAIIEEPEETRYQRLAKDYADELEVKRGKRKSEALVISPTHMEGELVTDAIRDELKTRGKISGEEREFQRLADLGWTDAEKTVAAHYEPGMVVKFRQNVKGQRPITKGEKFNVLSVDAKANQVRLTNHQVKYPITLPLDRAQHFSVYRKKSLKLAKGDKLRITGNGTANDGKYRLNNGDLKEISGFTKTDDIKLSNGKVIPKDYGHLNHGVCITADASQAKTVDTVFAAMSADSFGASDRRRFYVGLSRARHRAKVYTDDKEGLLDAVKRDQPRRSGPRAPRQARHAPNHATTNTPADTGTRQPHPTKEASPASATDHAISPKKPTNTDSSRYPQPTERTLP